MSLLTQTYTIFLTTKPLRRLLSEAQREWLYILPLQNLAAAALDVDIVYTDGSTTSTTVPLGNLRQDETVIVPMDFGNRDWNALNPSKTIRSITVALADHPEDVVVYERWEPRTDNLIELHYFNSLGGFDSFVCTGDYQEGIGFSKLIGKRFVQEGYLARTGAFYVDNQRSRDVLQCHSGFKPATEIEATKDMLHTNRIYRMMTIDGNQVLLPHIFEGDSQEYPSANTNLKAIAITLRPAWEEKARSRIV